MLHSGTGDLLDSGIGHQDISSRLNVVVDFVRDLSKGKIKDNNIRKRLDDLTYPEIAALKSSPEFKGILEGIIIKKLLSGDSIGSDMKWAMTYFMKDSGGYGDHDALADRSSRPAPAPIEVTALPPDA